MVSSAGSSVESGFKVCKICGPGFNKQVQDLVSSQVPKCRVSCSCLEDIVGASISEPLNYSHRMGSSAFTWYRSVTPFRLAIAIMAAISPRFLSSLAAPPDIFVDCSIARVLANGYVIVDATAVAPAPSQNACAPDIFGRPLSSLARTWVAAQQGSASAETWGNCRWDGRKMAELRGEEADPSRGQRRSCPSIQS